MKSYYYKFSDFLKHKYGEKVWKIGLDAGFSCPNCLNDGREGCIFCRNDSFSQKPSQYLDITEQMRQGIQFAKHRLNIKKTIAYFQTSTNTFAPPDVLRSVYNQALQFDGVVGISIATRPDCLSTQILDVIRDLTRKVDVWIELGLQSVHEKTLKRINRGHTYKDFQKAVQSLKTLPVRICTHLMIGLPEETKSHIRRTAIEIAGSGTNEVKIHPVLILKDTPLAELYRQNQHHPLDVEEYSSLAVDLVERLPADMVIQRLTAEAPDSILIAPKWAKNKLRVLQRIHEEFQRRSSYQGKCFSPKKL